MYISTLVIMCVEAKTNRFNISQDLKYPFDNGTDYILYVNADNKYFWKSFQNIFSVHNFGT